MRVSRAAATEQGRRFDREGHEPKRGQKVGIEFGQPDALADPVPSAALEGRYTIPHITFLFDIRSPTVLLVAHGTKITEGRHLHRSARSHRLCILMDMLELTANLGESETKAARLSPRFTAASLHTRLTNESAGPYRARVDNRSAGWPNNVRASLAGEHIQGAAPTAGRPVSEAVPNGAGGAPKNMLHARARGQRAAKREL